MVLEARLIFIFISATISFSSGGCSADDNRVTDKAVVENYELVLTSSQTKCFLDGKSSDTSYSKVLKIKPPCYFLRKENKKPQSFSYSDVGIISTLIVVGAPISNEKREKWNVDENEMCGESRQAILLKNSGLAVTEKTLEGGVTCKDKGADEKDFWYFAH
jgi:hypothetical protein